jgi:hypothetical protein
LEAFRRLLELVEEADLQREIKRISRSHGEEGIELKTGQRVRYRTRTKGGGRGFSGDCLILNEAMILPESAMGSVFPTLAARPNPQVWYTGSAVDQEVHEHGVVFTRVRERGHAGEDRLGWWEFGAPYEHPSEVPDSAARDPKVWAMANPSMGVRIAEEYIRRSNAPSRPHVRGRAPRRRRLAEHGRDARRSSIWTRGTRSRTSSRSLVGAVCFSYDVKPDRSMASIAVAGLRRRWAAACRGRRAPARRPAGSPGGSANLRADTTRSACLRRVAGREGADPAIRALDMKVDVATSNEHAQACAMLVDGVNDGTFRHLGTPELSAALKGAATRPMGDSWAWSRKTSNVDICPLVAVTLALGLAKQRCSTGEPMAIWD